MDTVYYAEQQDNLRPLRMFVGALQGALWGSEQSMAATDGRIWSQPYQYQTVGPWGVAVEGAATPVAATAGGGLFISPAMVLLGLGAAAMFFLKR